MVIKLKKNLCSGIAALVFGAGVMISLPYTIKSKITLETSAVGPDYLPKLVLSVMILCGIGLIFNSLVLKKDEEVEIDVKKEQKVLLYMMLFIIYGGVMKYIGFIAASLMFSAVSLRIMECRKVQYYVWAAVTVLFIFVSFKYGLKVPLPALFF